MKNHKIISLLILTILVCLICVTAAAAQSKIIRKTVKKIVKPEIAPISAPKTETTLEAVPTPPPPPSSYKAEALEQDRGIFGWGRNVDLGGLYLMNRTGQTGLLGVLGARINIIFGDPLLLGSKLGLAEDAMEYKLGTGLVFGSDITNTPINSIPIFADAVLYLKEGSFGGLDPFIGAGFNSNLYGTGQNTGGSGSQIYVGILVDFGSAYGKTQIALGYSTIRVATLRTAEGIFLSVTQPLIF